MEPFGLVASDEICVLNCHLDPGISQLYATRVVCGFYRDCRNRIPLYINSGSMSHIPMGNISSILHGPRDISRARR